MKAMHVKAIVAAFVLVAALVIGYFSGAWHEQRMSEGFRAKVDEYSADATADSEEFVRESFAVADAVNVYQSRKTKQFLDQGFAKAFSLDKPEKRAALEQSYALFFNPTVRDLTCDYTDKNRIAYRAKDCALEIDVITNLDQALAIPESLTRGKEMNASASQLPAKSNDALVYMLNGVYEFSKTLLSMVAGTVANDVNGNSVTLSLPNGELATRIFMLMRPLYIRLGVDRAALYHVAWGDVDYDSSLAGNTSVMLIATSGIDAAQNNVRMRTGPLRSQSFVPYYLRFVMANPQIELTTAYVATAALQVDSTVNQAGVGDYLSLQYFNAQERNVLINSAGNKVSTQGAQRTIKVNSTGWVFATYSYDRVVAAFFDESTVRLKTYSTISVLDGYTVQANKNTVPPMKLAAAVTIVPNVTIPNLADAAAMLGCLKEAPKSYEAGIVTDTIMFGKPIVMYNTDNAAVTVRDALKVDEVLLSDQALVSGQYKASTNLYGQLLVVNVSTNEIKSTIGWSRPSMSKSILVLGGDGVIRMYTGLEPYVTPYWQMPPKAPVAGGPYVLRLLPSGELRIEASGGKPVWMAPRYAS